MGRSKQIESFLNAISNSTICERQNSFLKIIYICIYENCRPVTNIKHLHCVKSVRVQRFFGLYFPTLGWNTERYSVPLRSQSECGKIRTKNSPNRDTFYEALKSHLKLGYINPYTRKLLLL